jgi:hypothetical protein
MFWFVSHVCLFWMEASTEAGVTECGKGTVALLEVSVMERCSGVKAKIILGQASCPRNHFSH